MSVYQIAIDGPAASGKSTVARMLAKRLGGHYVSTGDMYRAITFAVQQHGVDPREDPDGVARILDEIEVRYVLSDDGGLQLLLNGKPVCQEAIRSPEIAVDVSYVAKIPAVREWLKPRQRDTANLEATIVMEGRDIGTVILPDASHKFFVTASPEVRARRRLAQQGEVADGATVASVAAEIAERDRIDSTREIAPLRPARDAIHIDTDNITAEQVVERLRSIIRRDDAE